MVVAIDWRRELFRAVRFPFWFACLLAIVGVAWRPPLASIGLFTFFLVLFVVVEWVARRLGSNNVPLLPSGERGRQVESDENVWQRIVRSQTSEGKDRFEGTFGGKFSMGAMTATVHIPFCPAFERVPNVQVLPMDETDVSLRIISPKAFGVRVDVKRNNQDTTRFCFVVVAEEIVEQC